MAASRTAAATPRCPPCPAQQAGPRGCALPGSGLLGPGSGRRLPTRGWVSCDILLLPVTVHVSGTKRTKGHLPCHRCCVGGPRVKGQGLHSKDGRRGEAKKGVSGNSSLRSPSSWERGVMLTSSPFCDGCFSEEYSFFLLNPGLELPATLRPSFCQSQRPHNGESRASSETQVLLPHN